MKRLALLLLAAPFLFGSRSHAMSKPPDICRICKRQLGVVVFDRDLCGWRCLVQAQTSDKERSSRMLRWVAAATVVLLAVLLFTGRVFAQSQPRVCFDSIRGYQYFASATPEQCHDEWPGWAIQCALVANLPHCNPPATMRAHSPVPFDAPVRFDGVVVKKGYTEWRWVATGTSSRPCNAEELTKAAYKEGCAVPIGAVLFVTPRFFIIRPEGQ